jgi:tight adherence protein C
MLALAPGEDYVDGAPKRGFVAFKRERLARTSPAYVMLRVLLFIPTYYFERMPMETTRRRLDVKLARAGYPGGLTSAEFMAACLVGGLAGTAFGITFGAVGLERSSPGLAIICGCVCAYLPVLWLDDLMVRRLTAINRHMPFVLDLLSLSLGAGMDFNTSLDTVVRKDKGPLIEELHYVLQEIRLGVTRRDALINMKDRVQSEYMTSVVSAVIQAEAMGTPLSRILQVQAQANRLKRTQRAEKVAAEAGVKILFPLIMILIAVFLTMFGPIIVRYMNGELM